MVALSLNSCSRKQHVAIEEAVKQAELSQKNSIEKVGEGAPYFLLGDLNPTWNAAHPNIVKLPPFELVDQHGKKKTAEDFLGGVSIVAFFFTSCSGFCPTLLDGLKDVTKQLNGKHSVKYLALSVDTETDTPEVLKGYQKKMKLWPADQWVLLTGNQQAVFEIARNTLSTEVFKKEVTHAKSIIHSEHFYVFDRSNRLRGIFNGTRLDTPKEIEKLLGMIEQESSLKIRAR